MPTSIKCLSKSIDQRICYYHFVVKFFKLLKMFNTDRNEKSRILCGPI